MMKKIAIALALSAMSIPTFAQYEQYEGNTDFTDDETRWKISYIGSEPAENPGKLVSGYVTMMQMYYNSQNWEEMYSNWEWLMKNAPIASVSLYARGAVMLNNLIKSETATKEQKQKY